VGGREWSLFQIGSLMVDRLDLGVLELSAIGGLCAYRALVKCCTGLFGDLAAGLLGDVAALLTGDVLALLLGDLCALLLWNFCA